MLGSGASVGISSMAHWSRPRVSWELWPSRISSWGRSGSMVVRKMSWNHFSPMPSVIHPFLAHLSTKCSGWAIVTGLCPLSVNLFYLNIFSSETTHWIWTKLHRNDPWVVPYQSCSNGSDWCICRSRGQKIGFKMQFSKILSETTRPRAFIFGI